MIENEKELVFKDIFLDDLIRLEEYKSLFNPAPKARKLISDIYDFLLFTIAKMPFAFRVYEEGLKGITRRAIFKKEYVIYYDVYEDRIEFIRIHHTSQNPENISLTE
jgi:plasmid stabilization system protein ParE